MRIVDVHGEHGQFTAIKLSIVKKIIKPMPIFVIFLEIYPDPVILFLQTTKERKS